MATNVTSLVPTEPKIVNRWIQMCASIIAMMAIANLQYAWTLFTKPLTLSLHATLGSVGTKEVTIVAIRVLLPDCQNRSFLIAWHSCRKASG